MSPPAPSVWHTLEDETDTIAWANEVARQLVPGDLVILSGGLGAGKTFFTGALARALGLDEDEPVTSPTFTLVNEYETSPPLCHADLYRLTSEEDVEELGLDDRRADGWIAVVEWGAPFIDVLGGDAIHFEIELTPRRWRLLPGGPRARQLWATER